jgi:hypothetical protein
MSDQPLLTILEMGGEILEIGFSNYMDQIDNDFAEFTVVTIDKVLVNMLMLTRMILILAKLIA